MPTSWPFELPAPPDAFDASFLEWIRRMEGALSARIVEWGGVDRQELTCLERRAGGPVPPDLRLYYASCRPCRGAVEPAWDRWLTSRFHSKFPGWPVALRPNGSGSVAFPRPDGRLEARIFDREGGLLGRALGLRNLLVMEVAAEIVWDLWDASTPYAHLLGRPVVAQYSGLTA